jgi:hypothetical protein
MTVTAFGSKNVWMSSGKMKVDYCHRVGNIVLVYWCSQIFWELGRVDLGD